MRLPQFWPVTTGSAEVGDVDGRLGIAGCWSGTALLETVLVLPQFLWNPVRSIGAGWADLIAEV